VAALREKRTPYNRGILTTTTIKGHGRYTQLQKAIGKTHWENQRFPRHF